MGSKRWCDSLIFDLDGTLFQAKPVILLAVRRVFAELGLPEPCEDAVLRNAGRGAIGALLGVLPECADQNAVMPLYFEQMKAAILEHGELFPGVREALEQLRSAGYILIVCSNSPEEYIRFVLEHTGISGLFARYCSTEGYPSKAAAIGELIKPGDAAIVIGDTHRDIEAAHENGLPAIAVMYGYGNKSMLAAAEYLAYTPAEITEIVQSKGGAHENYSENRGLRGLHTQGDPSQPSQQALPCGQQHRH